MLLDHTPTPDGLSPKSCLTVPTLHSSCSLQPGSLLVPGTIWNHQLFIDSVLVIRTVSINYHHQAGSFKQLKLYFVMNLKASSLGSRTRGF